MIIFEKCKYKCHVFIKGGQFLRTWSNKSLPDSILHKVFSNSVISVSNFVFIRLNIIMEGKWEQYFQSVLRNVVSRNCQFVMLLDALETQ